MIYFLFVLLLLRFKHTTQAFADTQNMTNVFDVQQCIIEMSTRNRCVARRTFSEYEITINPSLTTCSPNRLGKLKFDLHQMFLARCKNYDAFFWVLRERGWKQRGCFGFALISWEKHPTPTSTTFFQAFLMLFEYLTPAYLKLPNEIVLFFPHSPSGRNGQKKMLHR